MSLSSIDIRDQGYKDSAEQREEINLIPVSSPLLFLHKWNEDDLLIHLKVGPIEKVSDTLDVVLKFCEYYKRELFIHLTARPSNYLIFTLVQGLQKWKQVVNVRLLTLDFKGSLDIHFIRDFMQRVS